MFKAGREIKPLLMPGLKWMENPGRVAGCPEGLQYLDAVEAVSVKQVHEWAHILAGADSVNRYAVVAPDDEQMFYLEEQSNWLSRICCSNNRKFWMDIFDKTGQMVARLYKKYPCSCNRYGYCNNTSMFIYAPPDVQIGEVKEVTGCCRPTFHVIDENQMVVYKIRSSQCQYGCSDIDFKLLDIHTNEQLGTIGTQWEGTLQERFTWGCSFGVVFPEGIKPLMKTIILGATIFIDLRFFEAQNFPGAPGLQVVDTALTAVNPT